MARVRSQLLRRFRGKPYYGDSSATDRGERFEKPFCRYYFVQGKCEQGDNCKYSLNKFRYSHRNMKDLSELHRFFRDHEAYLIDLYRAGKLRRVLYHFHEYLKKKAEDDPQYLDKWSLTLMKNEPQFVELDDILNVKPKERFSEALESSKFQSNFKFKRNSSTSGPLC